MNDEHDGNDDAEGGHTPHPGAKEDTGLSDRAKRSLAIQQLLADKGVIDGDDIASSVDNLRKRVPANGAKVVARAWTDPDYKQRLLSDPKAALKELGFELFHDAELSVMENTADIHHLVVCTLCSCYPIPLLGPPPDWYKSLAYRSRAVVEPRAVMREFGLDLDQDVEVRVMDSTADLRYLVVPRRPEGTEGMSEDELADLVTRDSMVGVVNPRSPGSRPAR